MLPSPRALFTPHGVGSRAYDDMSMLLLLLILLSVVAGCLVGCIWVRRSDAADGEPPPPSHHLVSLQRQCMAAIHERRWMQSAPHEDACAQAGVAAAKLLRVDGLVRTDRVIPGDLCATLLDHVNEQLAAAMSGEESSILSDVLCRLERYDLRLDLCPVVHAALNSALASCRTALTALLGRLTLPFHLGPATQPPRAAASRPARGLPLPSHHHTIPPTIRIFNLLRAKNLFE